MRVRPLPLAVLGLACMSVAPTHARAYCRLTTSMPVAGSACASSGTPLVWKRQCISYSVVPRARNSPTLGEIRSVVDRSFQTWGDVTCGGAVLPLALAQTGELSLCDKPEYNETAANVNSIIFVSDWSARALPPTAFGLTMVWHDSRSGEIVDADMQINETLGTLAVCGKRCAPGQIDMQNIVTHEAGHFLGLGHSALSNACMFGQAQVGETSKRYLSRDDEAGICAAYGGRSQPNCTVQDYVPDNSFASSCNQLPPQSSCGCSTPGASQPATSGMYWLGSALALAGLWRRRKRATRVTRITDR